MPVTQHPPHKAVRARLVRDVWIDYTALSLVAPEKVHFKYKLEGQDADWKEVVNGREAQYTNLGPRNYRFRVIASNNSGVWNEIGDTLKGWKTTAALLARMRPPLGPKVVKNWTIGTADWSLLPSGLRVRELSGQTTWTT